MSGERWGLIEWLRFAACGLAVTPWPQLFFPAALNLWLLVLVLVVRQQRRQAARFPFPVVRLRDEYCKPSAPRPARPSARKAALGDQ